METLWQQQDGDYALLWKRFLHLQQYSHRLNFNFFFPPTFWNDVLISSSKIDMIKKDSQPRGPLTQWCGATPQEIKTSTVPLQMPKISHVNCFY